MKSRKVGLLIILLFVFCIGINFQTRTAQAPEVKVSYPQNFSDFAKWRAQMFQYYRSYWAGEPIKKALDKFWEPFIQDYFPEGLPAEKPRKMVKKVFRTFLKEQALGLIPIYGEIQLGKDIAKVASAVLMLPSLMKLGEELFERSRKASNIRYFCKMVWDVMNKEAQKWKQFENGKIKWKKIKSQLEKEELLLKVFLKPMVGVTGWIENKKHDWKIKNAGMAGIDLNDLKESKYSATSQLAQGFKDFVTKVKKALEYIIEHKDRVIKRALKRTWKVCPEGPPTCNFAAPQKAIDKADSGDTIKVKTGTYEGNLLIDKDLTLKGGGQEEVTIKSAKEGHPVLLIGPSKINVKVKNLRLSGTEGDCVDTEKGICPFAVSITGKAQATIQDLTIADNWRGIWFRYSSQATIKDSTISDNELGIALDDFSQATIEDSIISNNSLGGIALYGSSQASITNSTIIDNGDVGVTHSGFSLSVTKSIISDNNGDGIEIQSSSPKATISKNEIKNNKGVGIESLSEKGIQGSQNKIIGNGAALAGNVSGKLRLSLKEAAKKNIYFPSADYPTLQYAIDALLPGGVIIIKKGQYEGGITLSKDISIKAKKGGKVELIGNGASPVISLINGANLHLENIKISKGYEGIMLGGNAEANIMNSTLSHNFNGMALCNSSHATIRGSKLSYNRNNAIESLDSSQVTVQDSEISYNLTGGSFFDSSQATITNSIILTSGQLTDGIILYHSSQVTVTHSKFSNTYWDDVAVGIEFQGQSRGEIANSTISGFYKGISIGNFSEAIIKNNKIHHNDRYGITLYIQKCFGSSEVVQVPENFKGKVKGYSNQFQKNGKALCPFALKFLRTEEGGEYPKE